MMRLILGLVILVGSTGDSEACGRWKQRQATASGTCTTQQYQPVRGIVRAVVPAAVYQQPTCTGGVCPRR